MKEKIIKIYRIFVNIITFIAILQIGTTQNSSGTNSGFFSHFNSGSSSYSGGSHK